MYFIPKPNVDISYRYINKLINTYRKSVWNVFLYNFIQNYYISNTDAPGIRKFCCPTHHPDSSDGLF